MTSLSTHVLDTSRGLPAAGVSVRLLTGDGTLVVADTTDADGRCPGLPSVTHGRYRLEFAVADYFHGLGVALSDPPFLDVVAIDFGIAGDQHYHVPLLVAPYGYSTYRGS